MCTTNGLGWVGPSSRGTRVCVRARVRVRGAGCLIILEHLLR